MTLDEIVDEVNERVKPLGAIVSTLSVSKKSIESGKGLPKEITMNQLALVVGNSFTDISPEIVGLIREANPDNINDLTMEYLPQAYDIQRDKLVEDVKGNYEEMNKKINPEGLVSIVLESEVPSKGDEITDPDLRKYLDSKKMYDKYKKFLEEEDTSGYIESVSVDNKGKENPFVRALLNKYAENDELKGKLLELMKQRVDIQQTRFLSNFADVEKYVRAEKDKNEEGMKEALKTDNINKYLKAIVDASDEGERKELYEMTGILYSQYLMREDKKKEDEELKDTLKRTI